jgi:integrase
VSIASLAPKGNLVLVFPNGAGNVESRANIITRGLVPAMIAAGVVSKDGRAKYTGLHSLRHFYASWCINRRVDGGLELPLKVVQARLGHASIQMTADVYGHDKSTLQVKNIARLLWPTLRLGADYKILRL